MILIDNNNENHYHHGENHIGSISQDSGYAGECCAMRQTYRFDQQPCSDTMRVQHLSAGAQLLLISVRQWTLSFQGKECACCVLRPLYRHHRAEPALPVINELMCFASTTGMRQLAIRTPDDDLTTADEMQLTRMFRAVEQGDAELGYRLAEDLFPGSLATTFFRIARAYIDFLSPVGLSFNDSRRLHLVVSNDLPPNVECSKAEDGS